MYHKSNIYINSGSFAPLILGILELFSIITLPRFAISGTLIFFSYVVYHYAKLVNELRAENVRISLNKLQVDNDHISNQEKNKITEDFLSLLFEDNIIAKNIENKKINDNYFYVIYNNIFNAYPNLIKP